MASWCCFAALDKADVCGDGVYGWLEDSDGSDAHFFPLADFFGGGGGGDVAGSCEAEGFYAELEDALFGFWWRANERRSEATN